jgi:hypothetical protein
MAEPIIVYLVVAVAGHLVWETSQLPLYTLWQSGTDGEIFRAVIHCTGGDGLISAAALTVSIAAARFAEWPLFGKPMIATTILVGVAYTAFSEWLNVEVRTSWAYAASMPIIPVLGMGLTPMMQWLVIPAVSFAIASRWRPGGLAGTSGPKQHQSEVSSPSCGSAPAGKFSARPAASPRDGRSSSDRRRDHSRDRG